MGCSCCGGLLQTPGIHQESRLVNESRGSVVDRRGRSDKKRKGKNKKEQKGGRRICGGGEKVKEKGKHSSIDWDLAGEADGRRHVFCALQKQLLWSTTTLDGSCSANMNSLLFQSISISRLLTLMSPFCASVGRMGSDAQTAPPAPP